MDQKKIIYKRILIIGTTSIIANLGLFCSKILPTAVIENACTEKNKVTEKKLTPDIPLLRLNKKETMEYLLSLTEEILCISFMNYYIFTEEVVSKKNLSIVNLHPALLPKYPGRNSSSWAIFNGETETGITWHYIDENIDNGYMIMQSKVKISDEDTAGSLILKLLKIAEISFYDIFVQLLTKDVKTAQLNTNPKEVKYARDIPNNGLFDLMWNFETASRFLRSFDSGFKLIYPPAVIKLNEEIYSWKRYKIQKSDTYENDKFIRIESKNIVIGYSDGCIILKDYELHI